MLLINVDKGVIKGDRHDIILLRLAIEKLTYVYAYADISCSNDLLTPEEADSLNTFASILSTVLKDTA